jgi:hypothetical protein
VHKSAHIHARLSKHQVNMERPLSGRSLSGWRRVVSAWALAILFAVGGFGAVELAPSLGMAGSRPDLHGARIPQGVRAPQHDPFDLGPTLSDTAEHDFDAPGELME